MCKLSSIHSVSVSMFYGAGIEDKVLQNNILQGAKWASITCIVVSAPVIGRVATVSFERALGTLCGGVLGYILYVVADNTSIVRDEVRSSHRLVDLLTLVSARHIYNTVEGQAHAME